MWPTDAKFRSGNAAERGSVIEGKRMIDILDSTPGLCCNLLTEWLPDKGGHAYAIKLAYSVWTSAQWELVATMIRTIKNKTTLIKKDRADFSSPTTTCTSDTLSGNSGEKRKPATLVNVRGGWRSWMCFCSQFLSRKRLDWSVSWGNNEAETERCGPLSQTVTWITVLVKDTCFTRWPSSKCI